VQCCLRVDARELRDHRLALSPLLPHPLLPVLLELRLLQLLRRL
jgi:hypothetical protein